MLLANFLEVHVNDLASLEVLVEEVADAVLGLSDGRKELLLGNLPVVSMPEDFVGLFFLSFGLDFGHSRLSHLSQNALLFLVKQGVELVVVDLILLLLLNLEAWHLHRFFLCLLVLFRLVLDSLLHNHVLENLPGHLHVCC